MKKSISRSLIAGGMLFSSTLGMGGCGHETSASCEIKDTRDLSVKPTSWPLGQVTVKYANETNSMFSNPSDSQTTGDISKANGTYTLSMKNLPKDIKTYNQPVEFDTIKHIVVAINSDQTGEVGFSSGCLMNAADANGFPEQTVDLPVTSSPASYQ